MSGLGVAVVGCGYWGINHLRVLTELPEVGWVVACDARTRRLQEIGERLPRVGLESDLEAVLSSPVDAVIVSTPATTHYEVARRVIEAGKHLMIEKPITTRSEDAAALIDLAEAKGVVLAVGHTFIHNPGVMKVKQLMEEGDVGRPYYLYSRRTNLGPIREDVNALWDLAPHDISIFNHLLGAKPRWVSAVGGRVLRSNREDFGFVSLGYPGNVMGHIHVSWADPNKVREIVVVGSKQRVVFDDLETLERVRVFEKGVAVPTEEAETYGEHQHLIRDGDILSPRVEPSEPLKNQALDFLRAVTDDQPPRCDGPAGRAVVEVMEAIDLSLKRRGAPVWIGDVGEADEAVVVDLRVLEEARIS